MKAAIPFPLSELSALSAESQTSTTFRAVFEHSPIAVARCNSHGVIVEMNPAFERSLDRSVARRGSLRLTELVSPRERDKTDVLLRDLLDSRLDTFAIEARGAGQGQISAHWTAWRQPGCAGEPDHALFFAEKAHNQPPFEETPVQNQKLIQNQKVVQGQKWEAIGRMTGGVVHDFNNLLTGVTLYCDLLLASLDSRDRRRRYADEIRSAIMQASSLVQQLLVFARPLATFARDLSLNDVATAAHDLLTRLIGENIILDLQLDPQLATVNMDQAQAQQILLNLVLNARDALPDGGRITIETSNCKFQTVPGGIAHGRPAPFPCILLAVTDNGHGMNPETQQRIFEPFFTTKNAGKGTGLGLTTVRSVVTANHGLIHLESEPDRGTRVMILLPQSLHTPSSALAEIPHPDAPIPSATPFQKIKKESLL